MKVHAAAFSEQGRNLIEKIEHIPLSVEYGRVPLLRGGSWVENKNHLRVRQKEPLAQWTAEAFATGFPIIFVGAAGIAVRAVAPLAASKKTDSPVLVVDELGKYVIPILSGHLGGANELAKELAAGLGGRAVITTATDVHGIFAADVFARRNNLIIEDPAQIADASGKLLRGERISLAVEGFAAEDLGRMGAPREVLPVSWACAGLDEGAVKPDLTLKTRNFILGIGCRKGKTAEEMEETLRKAEREQLLKLESIAAIASIDRKKEEQGLLELAQRLRRPFCVFSGEKLMRMPGVYTGSSFVEQTMGVDNVCERAAAAAAGGGAVVLKKHAEDGMTFAVAELSIESRRKRRLEFHE